MTIIGLTGGSGVGKSTVLTTWAQCGALTIDADEVYHRLLREDAALLDALSGVFPGAFISGALDRKLLGGIVFADEKKRRQLEDITHTAVIRAIEEQIEEARNAGRAVVAIDALYLADGPLRDRCDALVGVTAPCSVRVARIVQRDGVLEAYAQARIDAQRDDAYFAARCDYIIENNGGLEQLTNRAAEVYNTIVVSSRK